MSPKSEAARETGSMMLLPAKPGTCPECATAHDPALPHNQQSLYYQTRFYMQHQRYPTWRDAAAHCYLRAKRLWFRELRKLGQDIGPRRCPKATEETEKHV